MEPKSIATIISSLSGAIPDGMLKEKQGGGGSKQQYIEWHSAVKLLDQHAPGWHGEVRDLKELAGRVVIVYRITIPCAEGSVWREAIGNEDEDDKGYGDPFSNAQAMAFKRAAAMFGVGLYLYQKDKRPPTASTSAPRATQPAQVASGSLCTVAQQREIGRLAGLLGLSLPDLSEQLKVQYVADLTEARAAKVIARLTDLAAQKDPDIFEGQPRPDLEAAAAGAKGKK